MEKSEEPTVVSVRRSSLLHRWCIVNGSHETPTPWTDTADAVLVSVWIRDKADGPVKIRFELQEVAPEKRLLKAAGRLTDLDVVLYISAKRTGRQPERPAAKFCQECGAFLQAGFVSQSQVAARPAGWLART